MAHQKLQSTSLWSLARGQHGVVTRTQLVELGFSPEAVKHRVRRGRLHPVWRGVYAVGRPELTRHGFFMAAVLACGPEAALSHASAAALWGSGPSEQARSRSRCRSVCSAAAPASSPIAAP
jgi:Transcriptional regulator, AbiEi antitoxin